MHFRFTGPAVFFMRSQKVAPQESLCKRLTDISCF